MPGDRQQLRRDLMAVAVAQAGYFSAAQAIDVGYTYQSQKYHVDHGNWERVDRAIFRMHGWPIGPNDALVRWVLWSRGRGAVSHGSAAAAYAFGVASPAKTHLTVPPGFRMSDEFVVLHRADLAADDVTMLDGARITTATRTVLDIADTHADEEFLGDAITGALDSGLVTRAGLRARAEDAGGEAGNRIITAIESRFSA